MKRFLTIIFLLFLSCQAFAQLGELGLYPLRTDAGARPLGMGAAFVALADDANAVLYNPGGLAWAKGITLTFTDIANIAAVQAYPTGYGSSLGLAVINSSISGIPMGSGEASSDSSVISVSFGSKLNFIPALYKNEAWQRVGVGLTVKGLLGQTLRRTGYLDRSASGWDADLGVMWKGTDWWTFGALLQNILPAKTFGGGQIKWDIGGEEGIPASEKIALAAKIIGDIGSGSPVFIEGREMVLAGELNFAGGSPLLFRVGTEWGFNKRYYFRTGMMQQWKPGGVASSLNLGMGMRSDEWGVDLAIGRDPLRDQNLSYLSVSYYPKEWVVIRRLDVERPAVWLEQAIERISLEDNFVTYDDRIEITGKVKPGVEVYVNDQRAATGDDNVFKVIIPLQLGKNLIVVEARFESEKKIWTYKVLRKAKVEVAEEKDVRKELARAKEEAEKAALRKKQQELLEKKRKVEELVTLGVIEVSPEAEFRLEASVTRGEMATWLAKSAGLRLPKVGKDVYADVKQDHPLAAYIKAVVDWGLMKPFPDGTFRPDSAVSKEEGDTLFKLLKISRK
jgi:hypothetical protein